MGTMMIKSIGLIICLLAMAIFSVAQEDGCFEKVHKKNQVKNDDYYFDFNHDKTNQGDSFSCDLEMRPSEAVKAIESFRFGVLYDNEKYLRDGVLFPLTINYRESQAQEQKPKLIRIANPKEWIAFKKKHFTKLQIALIACSSLHNVGIVRSRTYGFTIGNGMIWFQKLADVPGVRVTAINLSPVGKEAVLGYCSEH